MTKSPWKKVLPLFSSGGTNALLLLMGIFYTWDMRLLLQLTCLWESGDFAFWVTLTNLPHSYYHLYVVLRFLKSYFKANIYLKNTGKSSLWKSSLYKERQSSTLISFSVGRFGLKLDYNFAKYCFLKKCCEILVTTRRIVVKGFCKVKQLLEEFSEKLLNNAKYCWNAIEA